MPQAATPVADDLIARMLPNGVLEVRNRATGAIVEGARLATDAEKAGGVGGAVIPGEEGDEVIRETPEEVIYRRGPYRTVYKYNKADNTTEVWDAQETIPESALRMSAGFFSPFVDSNPEEGITNYRPAGIEAVPSGLYQLYNLAADNSILPHAQNDYLDRATDRTIAADQSLRDTFGITPPENPLDLALEITGGLLLPTPKVDRVASGIADAAAMASGRTGGVIQNAIRATGSGVGGANVFGRNGGIIHDVGSVAAETLLPLRQGSLGTALATQVPLGLGVAETIDSADNGSYDGIVDAIDDATTEQPTIRDGIPQDIVDGFLREPDEAKQEEMATLILEGIENGEFKAPDAEEPAWRNPLVTGLSAIALFAGGTAGLRAAGLRNNAARTATGNLAGRRQLMQGTSLSARAMGGFVQSDQPLREAIRASGGGEDVVNRLTRNTPQSSDIIISHTLNTGQFPDSAIRMQSPAATLEALSKDLSPQEWDQLSNGLLANTVLDDVARTGTQAAFNDARSIADLQADAATILANPKLQKYNDALLDGYRKPFEYARAEGYLSQETFDALINDRPHYVPLSRNTGAEQTGSTLFAGSSLTVPQQTQVANLLERATDAGAGVKAGDAIDPIRGLPEYISGIIRKVEQNKSRIELFDLFDNNPALSEAIKRVPQGESSSADNVISAYRNGVLEQRIVNDPALYAALTFSNRLGKNRFFDLVSLPTRLTQAALTGPLAPFFQGVVSPAYDLSLGTALRPKGYDLGLLSEASNRLIPNLDDWLLPNRSGGAIKDTLRFVGDRLKALDPTALISPATGAARLGWDSFIEGQANSLTEQLIRQDGVLYRALGQQGTEALRDRLSRAYDVSIKSQMERVGASSSGLMMVNSSGQNIQALNNSAPNFVTRASRRAMEDAISGNPDGVNTAIQLANGFAARVGSTPLLRGYTNLMRILGEGFRYQAFATNAPKAARSTEAAQEIGNQTRRLSGDIFEHGSAELFGQLNKTVLYGNPAIQGMAQVGRSLKDQPVTTALNIAGFGALAMAIQYAAANDPETAEYIRNQTPEQQAGRIVLGKDLYIPVAQELRTLWGPLSLTLNDLTGINEGAYDGAYGSAFRDMLDGEMPSQFGQENVSTAFDQSVKGLNPYNQSASPIVNAIASSMGIDMGMTNYADSVSEVKAQEVSGLGGNGQLANDNIAGVDISANAMAVIEDLFSGVSTNFLRTAMDVQRAIDNDAETEDAINIGLSRLMDQNARRAGPVRGLLFGDHVFEQSSNTNNSRLYFAKNDGIDAITQIADKDLRNSQFTSTQDTATARPNEAERVDISGTMLMPIITYTQELSKQTADFRSQISGLNKAIADVRNQTRTSIEERNAAVNEYREEVEDLTEQALFLQAQTEAQIRQAIGDPTFSYQNFDPEKYKNIPYPAPTVQ